MDRGAFYVGTGEQYIEEAEKSARSIKRHLDIPTAIVTDNDVSSSSAFDQVIHEELKGHRGEASFYFSESPFDKTIYLDTDTYLCGDISGIFELLDRFDIAAPHAMSRQAYTVDEYPTLDVPECFPEYHRGIVGYVQNKRVDEFLTHWCELFRDHLEEGKVNKHDQPAMRKALYESDLRIATLTPEYGCRPELGYVDRKVKVLHGRNIGSDICEQINSYEERRIHRIVDGELTIVNRDEYSLPMRGIRSIKNHGIGATLKKAIGKLGS